MSLKSLCFIIGINLLSFLSVSAQEPAVKRQITGTVREENTGKPIRNISLFFDGSMNGTSTDSIGHFTLYPQTTSKLPILVSGVGYYSKTITDYSLDKPLFIDLKPQTYDLPDVTVKANDGMSRKEKIRIFEREFLGSSPNAKSCEILNEDDLRFTYSAKTRVLKASCDKPLIIHNKNLGYTLTFLLSNFTNLDRATEFYGSQFFIEDQIGADADKIEKARKNAYRGSRMHFIRSLWEDELETNGFRILKKTTELSYDSIVVKVGGEKYVRLKDSINIAYKWRTSPLYKTTAADILIEKNGYTDPVGLAWGGLMGAQRAGDLLPLEYDEKDKLRDEKEVTKPVPFSSQLQTGLIQTVITSVDALRSRVPEEKLYIQFDKPYYSTGDTLRMKAYLFDAAMLKGSVKSGIVYVELANDTNKVLFRRMLPVGFGLGTGNIILKKEDIPEGSYTLRAYTNLMRNFGEDLVFRKDFYVSGNSAENWLVKSQTVLSKQSGKNNLRLALQLNQFNKQSLGFHELDLRILDGKKVIQRDKVKTDVDGKLDVNFNLPENISQNNLSLMAVDPKDDTHKITIPVSVNRDENIDLQFMPEGGNLVAGIPSVVGFKAIGEDGRGTGVKGKVFSGNTVLAVFNSSYKGMGTFEFVPDAGENYVAKLDLNGATKSFPLPAVKTGGTALKVINKAESDSIEVSISIPASSTTGPVSYYLVARSRGIVCYGAVIRFNSSTIVSRRMNKNLFPTGIVHFTLLTADKQPLNERIAYIDHKDDLDIALSPVRVVSGTRDSIALYIEVKDREGAPVQGSFSLAVTDDGQVRTDSLASTILTSVLLTSDLKGTVEDPGHYLQKTPQAWKDLDNLLLTQGWIGYEWKEIFNPPAIAAYPAEPELVISGKVTNAFNKGSAVTGIQLLSLKPSATKISATGTDGSFSFGGLPVAEDMKFFLQAKNKNGKSFNVGIQVDGFKPVEFKIPNQRSMPWYVNSDTVLLRQASTKAVQEGKLDAKGTNLLQEVTIAAKKIVKDSKNLNGAGEADQILDEKDMAKDPKRSLLDLMKERVKGFGFGRWPTANVTAVGLTGLPTKDQTGPGGQGTRPKTALGTSPLAFHPVTSYKIFDKEMHLVIDGIDVESMYYPDPGMPIVSRDKQLVLQSEVDPVGNYILERNSASPDDRMNFIRVFLDGILAEDVKGIEVMSDPKFNGRYKAKYASDVLLSLSPNTADFAYVEVTTYSGNGAFIKTPPGVYLHKPMSYMNSTAFYRPRYTVKTSPLSDFRSTIHWEPDIVTDENGRAAISFYSADRPGTYSIIIEGSNMNGNVGRKTETIRIK